MKAWLIGLAISIFAVCAFFSHPPLAVVGLMLSGPALPIIFIFDKSIALPVSIAFLSFIYGGIAWLVIRVNQRRSRQ